MLSRVLKLFLQIRDDILCFSETFRVELMMIKSVFPHFGKYLLGVVICRIRIQSTPSFKLQRLRLVRNQSAPRGFWIVLHHHRLCFPAYTVTGCFPFRFHYAIVRCEMH